MEVLWCVCVCKGKKGGNSLARKSPLMKLALVAYAFSNSTDDSGRRIP